MTEDTGLIEANGVSLAYAHLPGASPTLVFLPGFASDMQGSKALYLRDRCAARGQALLRLDYSGHGRSTGRFEAGTITRWTEDAQAIIEARIPTGPLILAGSSMGGWIMLRLVPRLAPRITALIGIAAAPDFTEDLIRPSLPPEAQATLARDGHIALPNPYGPPTPITQAFLTDGAANLVLRTEIQFTGPVRLIHGQRDAEVPWQTSLRLAERLTSPDIYLTLIKDGEHRLSRESDLEIIDAAITSAAAPHIPSS